MKVMAWPGMILMSLGVSPFHSALTPSSLAIRITLEKRPPYLGG
eukprot:CAMPEP_0118657022 /NCGR_PEP_ID=MMETSP0785-20121206/13791_1 /TAXON_ID=91992 /ORGANISM="Bolidomonas pacifica, Strain CCMP 1866" /LENGTH=43 /DNA_ID= /DNA_START= /DNA_END= /DNA_ORIENTATION=